MLKVASLVNNPYQENTYVLYDETKNCVIIDPGVYTSQEQNSLINFINTNDLTPVLLLNTHCHIDHVLGNKFVFDQYGLKPQIHKEELFLLHSIPAYAPQQGFNYELSPEPEIFLEENGSISFGNSVLEIIFAPGHSPGHLCFYHKESSILIGGDVLFNGSIGRTDLPRGDYNTLISSIKNNIFPLPADTIVYPGHGPATTIGHEKAHNPFFKN